MVFTINPGAASCPSRASVFWYICRIDLPNSYQMCHPMIRCSLPFRSEIGVPNFTFLPFVIAIYTVTRGLLLKPSPIISLFWQNFWGLCHLRGQTSTSIVWPQGNPVIWLHFPFSVSSSATSLTSDTSVCSSWNPPCTYFHAVFTIRI